MPSMRPLAAALLGALALGVAGCGDDDEQTGAPAPAGSSASGSSSGNGSGGANDRTDDDTPRVIASGLAVPWDIGFLPGGDAIVTERDSAELLRIPAGGGDPERLGKVPGVVPGGEGGLLGVAVSPTYAQDELIYVYFTAADDNRIASLKLSTLKPKAILTGLAKGQIHNGGALEFGPDGKLYAGVGETGDTGLAQDRTSPNGKILRIDPDGSIPADNPIDGSPIWSLGHRNVQGLAWDGAGRLWASEFGQNTVDEVNLITKGANYGWPEVEGKGDSAGGKYTDPVVTWQPTSSSSPSGAAIVDDTLYVGALAGETLWEIDLEGAKAEQPEALFRERYGRIRGVAAGPSGQLWFTTSNRDGRGQPGAQDDRILAIDAD